MSALPPHLATPPRPGATAVAVVDGEHYPAVVGDTIEALGAAGWQVLAAALVGGGEKLRGEPDYGVPLVRGDGPVDAVLQACARHEPDWVVDASDEPVLVFEARARVIAEVAARGVSYAGADAMVFAPRFARIEAPSVAVIGTGKRIGKTAIAGHVARLAAGRLGAEHVVVVAMGRGGPREPVVVGRSAGPVTVERLLELSRQGLHAASDYLEDAALTGLTTIGCRRAGGGLLGAPVQSNVVEGGRIAEGLGPRLVIFEGSGSCLPPVEPDASLLLASTARPRDLAGDFGRYRLHRAGMVLVVGDDAQVAAAMVAQVEVPAVAVRLRPHPVAPVEGRRIAVFTTAPPATGPMYVEAARRSGASLVAVSHDLARRERLREHVADAVARGADTFVVEIKAAGIDVVAEAADAHGVDVVFLDNRPEPHDPSTDLDALLADFVTAPAR